MAKKKPKKRRSAPQKKRAAPQGVESHQRKQERLEARRAAKEAEAAARRKRERRERLVRRVALGALAAAAVWFFFLRGGGPESIQGHPIQTFSFTGGGSENHGPPYEYDTAPPVSGRHDPNPAECGTHAKPIPNERFVHTFEHGAVGIFYRPDVAPDQIEEIEAIVRRSKDHTFSAPYRDMENPIVVASWGRKMPLEELDAGAVQEYIETFRTSSPAPEPNLDCPNTAEESFEPDEAEASPQPPAPEGIEEAPPGAEPQEAGKTGDKTGADKTGATGDKTGATGDKTGADKTGETGDKNGKAGAAKTGGTDRAP